jgi:hypothetical protein
LAMQSSRVSPKKGRRSSTATRERSSPRGRSLSGRSTLAFCHRWAQWAIATTTP